jgi:hypothetical protein
LRIVASSVVVGADDHLGGLAGGDELGRGGALVRRVVAASRRRRMSAMCLRIAAVLLGREGGEADLGRQLDVDGQAVGVEAASSTSSGEAPGMVLRWM